MTYSITLEHGSDGSYLAWVHDLPGCFARGTTQDEAIANASDAIAEFREWLRSIGERTDDGEIAIAVTAVVESVIEADEDSEVLVEPDREPLSEDDWQKVERWLNASRKALLASLAEIADERLDQPIAGRERTIREQLLHIAFVELMYAAWTFDLRSRAGIADFLAWTRTVTSDRMQTLAVGQDDSLTYAQWAGAPRPEPWTARKAARRLILARAAPPARDQRVSISAAQAPVQHFRQASLRNTRAAERDGPLAKRNDPAQIRELLALRRARFT